MSDPRRPFWRAMSENTLSMNADGGLINTGRLVKVDPSTTSDAMYIFVYEGHRQVGRWLGTNSMVVELTTRHKSRLTHPDGSEEQTTIVRRDGWVYLALRYRAKATDKWGRGPDKCCTYTTLTEAEWIVVVELARRALDYLAWWTSTTDAKET